MNRFPSVDGLQQLLNGGQTFSQSDRQTDGRTDGQDSEKRKTRARKHNGHNSTRTFKMDGLIRENFKTHRERE